MKFTAEYSHYDDSEPNDCADCNAEHNASYYVRFATSDESIAFTVGFCFTCFNKMFPKLAREVGRNGD